MPFQTTTLVFHERLTAEMNVLLHQEHAHELRMTDVTIRLVGVVATSVTGLLAVKSPLAASETMLAIVALSVVSLVIAAVLQAAKFADRAAQAKALAESWNTLASDLRELDEQGVSDDADMRARYNDVRRKTDALHASDLGPFDELTLERAQASIIRRHAGRFAVEQTA